jgi:hypothetical protein
MSEKREELVKAKRCQHCGAEVPLERAVHRVVLGNPDRPGDYYAFSKNRKRMTKVGKPKGPGVVGPRPFCPACAEQVDRLLEEEHARMLARQRWALLAGGIVVALLVATALALALGW